MLDPSDRCCPLIFHEEKDAPTCGDVTLGRRLVGNTVKIYAGYSCPYGYTLSSFSLNKREPHFDKKMASLPTTQSDHVITKSTNDEWWISRADSTQ